MNNLPLAILLGFGLTGLGVGFWLFLAHITGSDERYVKKQNEDMQRQIESFNKI